MSIARAVALSSVAALALTLGVTGRAEAQTWTDFPVGSTTRKALVYVPEGTDNPPLLISLHGRGIGASWNQGGMMKFEPIADREKFVVVHPEAVNDLNWDLGGTSDIEFIEAIIDQMEADHGIDRSRVYASGFSMGGMFSHVLACRIPNAIAAIAPGNGYPLGGLSGCDDSRNVPIFHMHGTADDFVAYSGIHAFLQTRVEAYGCPGTPPVTTDPYPVDKPDSKSFTETWGPCPNANDSTSEIVLVSVAGMIHDWATAGKANTNEDPEFTGKPFDIDGSEEAWAFLKQYSLEGKIGDGSGTGGASGSGGAGGAGSGGAPGGGTGTGDPLGSGGTGALGGETPPIDGSGGGFGSPSSSGCSVSFGSSTGASFGAALLLFGLAFTTRRRAAGERVVS